MAGVPHAPDAALCPDGHHRRRFRMDDNPDGSDRRGTALRVRDRGLRSLDCGASRRAHIDQIGRVNEGGYPIGGASVDEVAILLRISSGRRLPARVGDESLDDPGPDLTGVPQPFDGQPAGQLTCAPMRGLAAAPSPATCAWCRRRYHRCRPGQLAIDAAATPCRPTGRRSLARQVIRSRRPPGTGQHGGISRFQDGWSAVRGPLVRSRDV